MFKLKKNIGDHQIFNYDVDKHPFVDFLSLYKVIWKNSI